MTEVSYFMKGIWI